MAPAWRRPQATNPPRVLVSAATSLSSRSRRASGTQARSSCPQSAQLQDSSGIVDGMMRVIRSSPPSPSTIVTPSRYHAMAPHVGHDSVRSIVEFYAVWPFAGAILAAAGPNMRAATAAARVIGISGYAARIAAPSIAMSWVSMTSAVAT